LLWLFIKIGAEQMFDITQSKLYQKLIANPDMVQEILDAHKIRTQVAPLGRDIAGMVYRSRQEFYYIVGNWMLDFDAQQFVFLHELYHILAEAPKEPYLLRMDWSREEVMADRVAEVAVTKYMKMGGSSPEV
jgi:Zn-dependent peptidase ImmA (M78 family)